MKKLLLIMTASLTMGGAFADHPSVDVPASVAGKADGTQQQVPSGSVAPNALTKAPVAPFVAHFNGNIDKVICNANLIYVIGSAGKKQYRVHYVSINGSSSQNTQLKLLCTKLLHNGLHVTFTGLNAGQGKITGANIHF